MNSGENARKKKKTWQDDVMSMEEELMRYGAGHHVTEIYSPPRATYWAQKMRLSPGMAFDLTQNGPEDGQPWDFNVPEKAQKQTEGYRITSHYC